MSRAGPSGRKPDEHARRRRRYGQLGDGSCEGYQQWPAHAQLSARCRSASREPGTGGELDALLVRPQPSISHARVEVGDGQGQGLGNFELQVWIVAEDLRPELGGERHQPFWIGQQSLLTFPYDRFEERM
jgi:hypothetical protein